MNDFDAIAEALEARMADERPGNWTAAEFADRALENFRWQYEHCETYRVFCAARGVAPDGVARWQDVPAVPATAFKYFDFVSDPAGRREAVFRSSGTTRGAETRSRHVVPRLSLYRAACLGPFAEALALDGERRPFVSLIPRPEEAPDSSLSSMVGAVVDRFASDTAWLVGPTGNWAPEAPEIVEALREAGHPVVVLGTALAFAHMLGGDMLNGAVGPADPHWMRLPAGSRVMETGGFKGARREISRDDLYAAIARATEQPEAAIVNEYGMTELLSQLYDRGEGHVAPPWLKVRALHPVTLAEQPEGEDGILAFFDLANLGSVSHILTEDVGSVIQGRLHLRGRAAGAEPRGCSRAMDELMLAAGRGQRT